MIDNINFTGRTDFFISPTANQKVERTVKQAYRDIVKGDNCRLYSGRTCSLHTDPDCLTVIVKNDRDGFFRYMPLNSDEETFYELENELEKLQLPDLKHKITAWIVGGTKIEGKQGTKLLNILNNLVDLLCDRQDIDTSILVGSRTGEEIFVIHPRIKNTRLILDKKINPNNNLETELENMFDVVELNNTTLSYTA